MILPEYLNLSALPSLPLTERKQLPKKIKAVYFAIDSLGNVQYVGKTVNIRSRWLKHHRQLDLEDIGSIQIAWLEVDDVNLLCQTERALIDHFKPPLNGLRNPIKRTRKKLRTQKETKSQEFISLKYVSRLKWDEQLGQKLRLIRGDTSRRKLAEQLNKRGISCTHQSIQYIESGETASVDINLVTAICKEVGSDLGQLFPVLTVSISTNQARKNNA